MDRETLLAPWAELGISAIENDRVAILDDWRFLTPSTAMIDLAEHIVVHAERWRDEKSPPEEITQSFSKE
jgi:multisubunit Na+/H+ antiporter MnhE subunit